MKHEPETELQAGIAIVEPALSPHGFVYTFQHAGRSSGGNYAWGKFVRDDRSLHLHHRWGLGIIQYQIANLSIDHPAYLRSLGVDSQSELLSLPLECGLDRYRALRSDLEQFCSDFVVGPATEWSTAAIVDGQRRAEHGRQLNAGYVGDDQKRQQARELFLDKRYADAVTALEALQYPDLMNRSEERMLQLARERANSR